MKLLKEFKEFEYEILKETVEEGKAPKLFVKGVIQRADTINQNGRIYPKDILFREVENYKQSVLERRATGCLDHCLSDDTEILTKDGWKQIHKVKIGEEVITLDIETNEMIFQKVDEVISEPYMGLMYHITNGKKMDMLVSPNHKLILWNRYEKIVKKTANEFYQDWLKDDSAQGHSFLKVKSKWNGLGEEIYTVPNTDISMSTKTWVAFFGLWLAEGFVAGSKGSKIFRKKIGITQKKPENIKKIDDLLALTGLKWVKRQRKDKTFDWYLHDSQLHSYLSQFGNSFTKFIPRDIMNFDIDLLKEMLDWMLLGDGRNRLYKPSNRLLLEYSTISKRLAEDVGEIMIRLGYRPYVKSYKQPDSCINGKIIKKENCQILYTASANISNSCLMQRYMNIKPMIYIGNINCINVPNHTFLARRNGYVFWTGNSDSPVVELKDVSHLITDIWTENDAVMAKIEILPTPMGNIARNLIESNVKVGISSRALGSVRHRGDADIVENDLHLICWDLVSEPSTTGAWLQEGKDIDPKILNQIFSKEDRVNRAINDILSINEKTNK